MFPAKINFKKLLFILGIALILTGFLCATHATYYPVFSKPNLTKNDDDKKEKREEELKKKKEQAEKEKKRKEELEKKEQEAKEKKRNEELERKKKEQEEKKEKEQYKNEYKTENRDEPQYRYINPIVRDYDRDPAIYIQSLRLLKGNGSSGGYFEPNDTIDLEVTYRVTSYEGFDDVDISWYVWDGSKRQVYSSSRSVSLRSDMYVTEVIHNAVPMSRLYGSSEFSVKVEVEVENRRTQRKVDGNILGATPNFRLLNAYLTNKRSHDSYYPYYPGYPASSFNDGDPYWLIIEYDIDGYPQGDLEVDYKFSDKYGYMVFHDSFWTKAYRGEQTIFREGWIPLTASSTSSRFTLDVKVKYKNSIKSSRSFYTIASKYDYSYSDWYYRPDNYIHRPWLTEVYPCQNARGWKTGRNFTYDDEIYLIVKYNPYYGYSENIRLNWIIFDAEDRQIIVDSSYVKVTNDGAYPVKLVSPQRLPAGKYRYLVEVEGITDEPGDIKRNGDFEIVEQKTIDDQQNSNPENINEDPIIEYQIDERMAVNLPASWGGEFNYDENMPPFVFSPAEDVRGMILSCEFENKELTFGQAIEHFEKIESNATGIENHILGKEITLDDLPARLLIYNGKVTHKGEFLEEFTEQIEIALVCSLVPKDDKDILYVIRIIAPRGNLSGLIDYATSFSDKVRFIIPEE